MNSLGLLTLVSDAGSAGLHWASRWPVGPCVMEATGPLRGPHAGGRKEARLGRRWSFGRRAFLG
jgi:hypothetical protein